MNIKPAWLSDAVFYEIYPQSFNDTNNDGIGDIQGIIEKLDYIKSIGCNALWINPWYDSPFKDAGYDVRDYKKIAPRYGTNEDAYRLFAEAHRKGIHVLLDLVPGHTSEEHEWFRESQKAEKNEYTDRYIWTDFCFQGGDGLPYIAGESERSATYILNFFKCQPALNYGFLHPRQDWQQGMDAPGPRATVAAMEDVMRFWLDHGADGFRVDMAASLVKKDDSDKTGTGKIWREVRQMLDRDYPEAAMVSEWSEPTQALQYGFHMDFYLNQAGNGYSTLMRDYYNVPEFLRGQSAEAVKEQDHSYFRKDTRSDITRFTDEYAAKYEKTKDLGLWCMLTCNHDTQRPRWTLGPDELKIAYAAIFLLPGAPFLYYGDEIGMRYLEIPTKEGGYFRTGSRTPMQWDHTENLGFSGAGADQIYLPVDSSPDAPTAEGEENDPDSLLNTVRKILSFRHSREELRSDAPFELLYAQKDSPVLVFARGNLVIAVNPKTEEASAPVSVNGKVIFTVGNTGSTCGEKITAAPQSVTVFEKA